MARPQHNHTTAYPNGLGTNVNYTGAFEWMTRATKAGLSASRYSLASYYKLGVALGEPELELARECSERTASKIAMRQVPRRSRGKCPIGLSKIRRALLEDLRAVAATMSGEK